MTPEVFLLEAGRCRQLDAISRSGGRWAVRVFPAGFACILHARHGAVLFDSGYARRFLDCTSRWPWRLYRLLTPVEFRDGEEAVSQVASLGIAADAVGTLLVSHFHGDHVAGLADFDGARIVCSSEAWQQASSLLAAPRSVRSALRALHQAFVPAALPVDLATRVQTLDLSAARIEPTVLSGLLPVLDYFGDGTLFCVPLPGHARGQMGLYLPRSSLGAILLVADAIWSVSELETNTPPPRLIGQILWDDPVEYVETLDRLHRIRRSDPGLTIAGSHCPASRGHLREVAA